MTRRITIIGGGVIGLFSAYECLRRGWQVAVIDRVGQQARNCSYGNAGMVVPSHFIPLAAPGMVQLGLRWMWNPQSPFAFRPRLDWEQWQWAWRFWRASNQRHVDSAAPVLRDLHLASRDGYLRLAADLPDFGLTTRGLLMLCKHSSTLEHEAQFAAHANRLGIEAQVLDAQGVATLDPDVRMAVAGAVYFPKDCHLAPDLLLEGLRSRCLALGGAFHWESEVVGFEQHSGRLQAVITDKAKLETDDVVLCGGVWSNALVRQLHWKLPMEAGKGYSLTLPQPCQLPRLCSIFTEARIAVTPMGSSLRFGGTMELTGLDERLNRRRIQGIIQSIPEYFPDFRSQDFIDIQPWLGLRPCSPDGLPYLGRTRRFSNLVVATGHAMMGLSLAPITGRLVVDLLDGQPVDFDLTKLSPDRFG